MNFRTILAAATMLAVPALGHAQSLTGPYISLAGGTSLMYSVGSTFIGEGNVAGNDNQKTNFRPDYAGIAGIGYGLGDGFRVELDGDYIRNTAYNGDVTFNNTGFAADYHFYYHDHGGENKYGPMVNVLYDIPLGLPVTPYIGAGAGYQWVAFNRDIAANPQTGAPPPVGGTEGSFAYDVIAGLSYALPSMPQLALTAEFRFMQLTSSRTYQTLPAIYQFRERFGTESSDTLTFGLRYALFAPAMMAPAPTPAPAASPAPAAAKTYLVFFDWDKYSLTPRATEIIAEAASDSKSTGVTTLDVSGYTDTSGTPDYNQGLSERRAKAVAAKLVADGVPASEISIHAYGETHLLVPTGPGVREPQNRRVEIVLN